MYEPTCDPGGLVIESRPTPTSVIYLSPSGERWRIDGVCNQCGECWKGVTTPKPTLDCPIRPESTLKFPSCSLSGEYL